MIIYHWVNTSKVPINYKPVTVHGLFTILFIVGACLVLSTIITISITSCLYIYIYIYIYIVSKQFIISNGNIINYTVYYLVMVIVIIIVIVTWFLRPWDSMPCSAIFITMLLHLCITTSYLYHNVKYFMLCLCLCLFVRCSFLLIFVLFYLIRCLFLFICHL